MTLATEIDQNGTSPPEKLLAPVLSAFWDQPESWTLDTYRRHEATRGLRKALAMTPPDDLIAYVKDSGLRGRGGAGFPPTGMKWQFIPQGDGKPPHYLVVNADESEPGDLQGHPAPLRQPAQPHRGIVIACYAIRSSHAFIYLRGEVVPRTAQAARGRARGVRGGLPRHRHHGLRARPRTHGARRRRRVHLR